MKKIVELKNKLLLLTVYTALLLIFWFFDIPCLYKHFLSIPCPGCGMSRAIFSMLRLDFAAAFNFHPMFWSMPILLIYFFLDGKIFGKKYIDYGVLLLITVGFILNWLKKLL